MRELETPIVEPVTPLPHGSRAHADRFQHSLPDRIKFHYHFALSLPIDLPQVDLYRHARTSHEPTSRQYYSKLDLSNLSYELPSHYVCVLTCYNAASNPSVHSSRPAHRNRIRLDQSSSVLFLRILFASCFGAAYQSLSIVVSLVTESRNDHPNALSLHFHPHFTCPSLPS